MAWPTTTNNIYRVQSAPSLGGPWTDLAGPVPGDGTTNLLFDPLPSGSRYYQVLEIVPGSPAVGGLPVNGGFETGTGVIASNWVVSQAVGGPVYAVRTNSTPRTGSSCFEVHLASTGAGPVVEFTQSGVPVTGGTAYPFTFYANALAGSAGYNAEWRVLWNAGGDTGYRGYTPGNSSYALISNSVTAPAAASSATLFFHFAGAAIPSQSATIRLDDIALGPPGSSGSPGQTNVLQVLAQAMAKISFLSASGTQYLPESTANLASPVWTSNPPPILGDGGIKSVLLPMTNQSAFFRLRTPSAVAPPANTNFVSLFDASTVLEPPVSVVTSNALVTYLADRARDRHARESNFQLYDHYLSWYWEQRVANIEIIDHVAKGGTDIIFNYTTQAELNPAEFRTCFRGINTVAEYSDNAQATLVSTNASATPGETDFHYTASINSNAQLGRPLQLGDRVELEISQFLLQPRHGRNNYYGTALLYIVGQGIVPWAEGQDMGFNGGIVGNVNQSLDSYTLPVEAWLGGQTTLPYQYSDEPVHRFKETAGNISPTNGQLFMLGRRLHHTDFGDGTHSEPDNPVFTEQLGKLGPKFINRSCVACHVNNGRALPPAIGAPMLQSVVKVGSDGNGSPHPTLGSVLQPQSLSGPPEAGVVISSYTTNSGRYGDGAPYSLQKPNYTFQGI
ncbi:MAG TPA: di-heme oxidoredictase family protein, partial [Candidatus Dormibacteraeota bacterium]|nr:di-heme oxidoredictase family protein [Candidatus Dormibacteraeota bacterium]